jgi:hypothetical protein
MTEYEPHRAGELAFADFLRTAPIPVTVLAVVESGRGSGNGPGKVRVRLNATRGAYRCGEVLDLRADQVIPRGCMRTRGGHYRIGTAYEWVV